MNTNESAGPTDSATPTEIEVLAAQADVVDRGLSISIEGDTQHTVQTISQTYPTTVADLWDACTDPARLERWFAPVSGDLELGGRYAIEGNASGTIEKCEPLSSYSLTWEFAGGISYVTVRVTEADAGARFTLEHSHSGEAGAEFWTQFGPGATGVGWDLSLLGLAFHLVAGTGRPENENEWVTSAPAQEFVRTSSTRWGEASIAAGTPADEARAAADRTTGFYLGQPPTE
ncbi:SRPBCC family protein [Brevibacterium spongiae]|uniref:SRPBCC family protein n=1 Tax=Brevibacterium spongiae TaxID=2909672 RepID=A0ABY5ST83_9MICO|nr:SRPBCC family protein [Brevibacterium spongiae]UVI36316.1 SRPBCC family protein [Brevibacterium spongiae]